MKVIRDYQGMTSKVDDIDTRLSEEQKAAARRTVAHLASRAKAGAKGAYDAMMMLGIHPSQVADDDDYLTTYPQELGSPGRPSLHTPPRILRSS